jgi:hypothetical protein
MLKKIIGISGGIASDYCDFEPTLRFMNKYYFEGYMMRLAKL